MTVSFGSVQLNNCLSIHGENLHTEGYFVQSLVEGGLDINTGPVSGQPISLGAIVDTTAGENILIGGFTLAQLNALVAQGTTQQLLHPRLEAKGINGITCFLDKSSIENLLIWMFETGLSGYDETTTYGDVYPGNFIKSDLLLQWYGYINFIRMP